MIFFYCQPIYVGDSCDEYHYMDLKCDNDVGKIFFIYSEFSTKCPIELNETFEHSPNEIFVLLCQPRIANEIIALMCDKSV